MDTWQVYADISANIPRYNLLFPFSPTSKCKVIDQKKSEGQQTRLKTCLEEINPLRNLILNIHDVYDPGHQILKKLSFPKNMLNTDSMASVKHKLYQQRKEKYLGWTNNVSIWSFCDLNFGKLFYSPSKACIWDEGNKCEVPKGARQLALGGCPEPEKSSNTQCAWCQEVVYTPALAWWPGRNSCWTRLTLVQDPSLPMWELHCEEEESRPEAAYGQDHGAWTWVRLGVHVVSGTGC